MNTPLPDPRPPAPDEGLLRDLLRDALGAEDAEAGDDGTAPEETVLADLERAVASDGSDAATRTLLADVGRAVLDAESGRRSPAVEDAALRAFDRFEVAARSAASAVLPRGAGSRVAPSSRSAATAPSGRRPLLRPLAAAAALLVGIGVVFALRSAPADAALRLDAVYRRDLARGSTSWESGRVARVGEWFEAGPSSLVALAFPGEARVVLGAGDAVRVLADRPVGLVTLERGGASLRAQGTPIRLRIGAPEAAGGTRGVLEVVRGAVRVETGGGETGRGDPEIAVADGGEARFVRDGAPTLDLRGPTRVRVGARDVETLGSPDRSLFRDLAYFGGDVRRATDGAWMPARAWRVLDGTSRRASGQVVGASGAGVTVAWRPGDEVGSARLLRIALRGPEGTEARVLGLGADGGDLVATLGASAAPTEPGLPTLEVPLPAGWHERLAGAELRLAFDLPKTPPGSRGVVRFDGATIAVADMEPTGGATTPGSHQPEERGDAR